MKSPRATECAAAAATGAIDLMAKLAVLIVAALLFAVSGIREARTQTLGAGAEATMHGKPQRPAMLRRPAADGASSVAAAPALRKLPLLGGRF